MSIMRGGTGNMMSICTQIHQEQRHLGSTLAEMTFQNITCVPIQTNSMVTSQKAMNKLGEDRLVRTTIIMQVPINNKNSKEVMKKEKKRRIEKNWVKKMRRKSRKRKERQKEGRMRRSSRKMRKKLKMKENKKLRITNLMKMKSNREWKYQKKLTLKGMFQMLLGNII